MGQEVSTNIFSSNLVNQYDWFNSVFLTSLKNTSDEFFEYGFSFKLMSVSLNINAMFQDDSYFVTKINIDEEREVFVRCSEKAIGVVLEKVLEPLETIEPFNLNMMTELEAKIITSFNDMFYTTFANKFSRPKGSLKFKTLDILHLTFLVKPDDDKDNKNVGKIILSMPYQFLNPEEICPQEEIFSDYAFSENLVEATIKIGTTLFSVQDLKSLEPEDIVVFENSNIHKMKVFCGKYIKNFDITPNPALIIAVDDSIEGEMNMEENSSVNLWDSIQVEMGAEFDKVKIPLGDLKKINDGVIVDIASIYSNKISLKVEEKLIAEGELVIVNDRYGVKVSKVFAEQEAEHQPQMPQQSAGAGQYEMPQNSQSIEPGQYKLSEPSGGSGQYGMQQQFQAPPGIDPQAFAQLTPEQQEQVIMQYQLQQQQNQQQFQVPPGIDPQAFAQLTPEQQQQVIMQYQQQQQMQQGQGGDDFDYSDFDIDEEDI